MEILRGQLPANTSSAQPVKTPRLEPRRAVDLGSRAIKKALNN